MLHISVLPSHGSADGLILDTLLSLHRSQSLSLYYGVWQVTVLMQILLAPAIYPSPLIMGMERCVTEHARPLQEPQL